MSNESEIYQYLKDRGLTPAQVAGVMGNLKIESGFSPTASNRAEGAIGIAQWEGGRRTALQHYASSHGGKETSLTIQLGFMWHELTGSESGALKALKQTHDPAAAATVWDSQFERSDGSARGARISSAHAISKSIQAGAFGGKGSGGNGSSGLSGGGGGKGRGSKQRLVVHPSELADVISQVNSEADTTAYIVRGMTRHIAELDALVSGGQVVPDPARFNLARRGLEEALTGKYGAQRAAQGLSDVATWVTSFLQQLLDADGPGGGAGMIAKPGGGKKGGSGNGGTPVGHRSSRSARVKKMLAFARTQHANDGGNNRTKYGAWYGSNGVAWCAQFVSYVFAHSGNRLPSIDGTKGKGFQYVPDAINYARAHHQLFTKPRVGDIFLCHDGHHTGIVSRVFPDGHFDTVEGNAGANTDRVVHGIRGGSGDPQRGTYYFWTAIRP
ncbi:MAG: hypothetical protein DLM58_01665 [Pseudonocardiales bacterium]|nr:MAG: hypothetical protein DLM58_01665 [Pseudonocardiales bacterium]